jgi:hypothetical protein
MYLDLTLETLVADTISAISESNMFEDVFNSFSVPYHTQYFHQYRSIELAGFSLPCFQIFNRKNWIPYVV